MVTQDKEERKNLPITTGVLDYFPDALLEVARCSKVGNDQHNPGEPLHWAKEKSTDEPDALVRHLLERGTFDWDGIRHSAKVAWRALAMLQREIEAEREELAGALGFRRVSHVAVDAKGDCIGCEGPCRLEPPREPDWVTLPGEDGDDITGVPA